jgi:hypothetical protein
LPVYTAIFLENNGLDLIKFFFRDPGQETQHSYLDLDEIEKVPNLLIFEYVKS